MDVDLFALAVVLASLLTLVAAPLLAAAAVAAFVVLSYRLGYDSRDGVESGEYRRRQLWRPHPGRRD